MGRKVQATALGGSIGWRSNLALRGDLGKEPGHKFVFRLERPRNLPAIDV